MEILLTILLFIPFVFILWLANLAQRGSELAAGVASNEAGLNEAGLNEAAPIGNVGQAGAGRVWAILAYLSLVFFYGLLIMFGVTVQLLGAAATGSMADSLGATYQQMGLDPAILAPIGRGMWLPSIFGIVLLLRVVRNLVGRLLPAFDPANPVHAVAFSYIPLIAINLLVTVGVGLGNLANMMQSAGPTDLTPSLWAQEIIMALMAVIGVGWLSRRSLAQVLQRLAIVVPTLRQFLAGIGIGVAMAAVITVLEVLLARVGVVTDADVQRLSEQLLGPLVTHPFGIITLGVAAALGEECIFRGALQPRFGILLTTLLFALLHSTYGLSLATLLVFLVGLLLGLVRQRANTTTSMLVHATYNMTLGLIAALGLFQDI